MRIMKFSMVFLALSVFLQGCVGVGYEEHMIPVPSADWTRDWEYQTGQVLSYRCKEYKVLVEDIHIFSTPILVGPLIPFIPFYWPEDSANKEPNLVIDIRIDGKRSTTEKAMEVHLRLPESTVSIEPYSIESKTTGHKHRYFFNVKRDEVEHFTLHLKKAPNNCSIPPLKYERENHFRFGVAAQ